MKRLFTAKPLIAAAIALSAIAGTSAMAQPRHDGRNGVVILERHGYHQPAPAHVGRNRGGPMGDADRDGIPNRFDRDSRFYDPRATRRSAEWSDWDRDGVVNKFDRFPRNPRRS